MCCRLVIKECGGTRNTQRAVELIPPANRKGPSPGIKRKSIFTFNFLRDAQRSIENKLSSPTCR